MKPVYDFLRVEQIVIAIRSKRKNPHINQIHILDYTGIGIYDNPKLVIYTKTESADGELWKGPSNEYPDLIVDYASVRK